MLTPKENNLPVNVQINQQPDCKMFVSAELAELFIASRSDYDWPEGTGAEESQGTIIALEKKVDDWLTEIDTEKAHAIIQAVSKWGGNNKKAQKEIDTASKQIRATMMIAIQQLLNVATLKDGLDSLSQIPGLRLVMATKVFRFCCPNIGAAVDRHASYFFNSLDIVMPDSTRRKATNFKREWTNGKHTKSRLSIYNDASHAINRDEYVDAYLPLVAKIAEALNGSGATYSCAATKERKTWRPADVEMAGYYWWARHGTR